ncbi:hypothetical protein DLNHIDIE_03523 [Acidithiobacillus thiooxidans ATCC 19377]|uniref:Uncharacterized protein n=1 Tax=Acidithiobacillus thiooxidans ATCC 19377 TaxID=637390 RepID=A0A543PYK0_ACITH|nr:hypothetical protein DLNHIDIE_03523 [Acidithiobacillus thiooxidans ATCC 19377]
MTQRVSGPEIVLVRRRFFEEGYRLGISRMIQQMDDGCIRLADGPGMGQIGISNGARIGGVAHGNRGSIVGLCRIGKK